MFDLGFAELLIIGVVALIVVGPKDLPGMFRTVGRLTGKARAMARDFQRAMDDAAEQSGMSEVSKGLKAASNPAKFGLDAVKDAAKEATDAAKEATSWEPDPEKLSPERAEVAKKIHDATAKKASARLEAEAEAAATSANADPAPSQDPPAEDKA